MRRLDDLDSLRNGVGVADAVIHWDGVRRSLRWSLTSISQAILKRTRKRSTRGEEQADDQTE
jgi:hypothetical protein